MPTQSSGGSFTLHTEGGIGLFLAGEEWDTIYDSFGARWHRWAALTDQYLVTAQKHDGIDPNDYYDTGIRYILVKRDGLAMSRLDHVDYDVPSEGTFRGEMDNYGTVERFDDDAALHFFEEDNQTDHMSAQVVSRNGGETLSVGNLVHVSSSATFQSTAITLNSNEALTFVALSAATTLTHLSRSGTTLSIVNQQVLKNDGTWYEPYGAAVIDENTVVVLIRRDNTGFMDAWVLTRSPGSSTWTLSDETAVRDAGNANLLHSGGWMNGAKVAASSVAFSWIEQDSNLNQDLVMTVCIKVTSGAVAAWENAAITSHSGSGSFYGEFCKGWADLGVWGTFWYDINGNMYISEAITSNGESVDLLSRHNGTTYETLSGPEFGWHVVPLTSQYGMAYLSDSFQPQVMVFEHEGAAIATATVARTRTFYEHYQDTGWGSWQ